jgi:hypothetical protein
MIVANSDLTRISGKVSKKLANVISYIPAAVRRLVKLRRKFLKRLHVSSLGPFMDVIASAFGKCKASVHFQWLTVILAGSLGTTLDPFFQYLYVGFSFDPTCTLYGPMSLDKFVTTLRGTIKELLMKKALHLILKLVGHSHGFPFLIFEIFSCILCCARSPFLMLFSNKLIVLAHWSCFAVVTLGGSSDARTPCVLFLSEFLRDSRISLACLKNNFFLRQFLNFLCEKKYRGL